MFSEYFSKQAGALKAAHEKNLAKRGVTAPAREKDLAIFQEFYSFLKEHLPPEFSIATGKVRNRKHLLNRSCDALVYRKWFPKMLEAAGGYVLSDALYSFLTIDSYLTPAALATHVNLTRAMKTLYAGEREYDAVIPMYSVLFAYSSERTLLLTRQDMRDAADEKEIPINHEPDLICILDRGIIIKDWESGGGYRVVETEEDTLMWFYILFLEYLDRDGRLNLNLRDYVKVSREYNEY